MNMQRPVPVHVLTGFLGSGKTTLLNALLKHDGFNDTAVIINEFGEQGLDHLLVEKSDDQIIELSNGCLCCTVRGQLVDTLEMLVERNPKRIIIETTGLADPLPVLQALIHTPSLATGANAKIQFAGLTSVFDAVQGPRMLKTRKEAQRQIAMADLICISKLDVCDGKTAFAEAERLVRSVNPNAIITPKEDLIAAPQILLETATSTRIIDAPQIHSHPHNDAGTHHVGVHNARIKSVTLKHDRPLARNTIDMFLELLFSAHGNQILRLKGLVAIKGEDVPLLIQGVGNILAEARHLAKWPSGDHTTRIVVFLDGLDPDFLKNLFASLIGKPATDTPDFEALTNNPLAIPGLKS